MTILTGPEIRDHNIIHPTHERTKFNGVTYGLGPAGYDVRVFQDIIFWPGRFVLASTVEFFSMPNDVMGIVHDKSTWARLGIAVQNTVIEPGWKGYLTLELNMHSWRFLKIKQGTAIAQIIFHKLSQPVTAYSGKYQGQGQGPQKAILEK